MAPHIHIVNGLNLCKELPPDIVHTDSPLGYLYRLFLMLGETLATFYDDFSEESLHFTTNYLDAEWQIPSLFTTSKEAHECVDTLLKRVARLDIMSEGDHPVRRRRWWQIQQQLCFAIASSMRQCEFGGTLHHDFRSLLLHLRVIAVMLKTNILNDETIYDSCGEDFEYIVSESEELLAFELAPGSERGPGSVRSSLGLIPPLFFVATKCRFPALRRRALELLHGSRRRERLWNSCVASRIAEALHDVENSVSPGYSPSSSPGSTQSVCLTHVGFDRENGLIEIQYKHSPWDETTAPESVFKKWKPVIDDNYEFVELSHKSMRAMGYSGTILVSPRIGCQCGEEAGRF
jgi:hypothetical protein